MKTLVIGWMALGIAGAAGMSHAGVFAEMFIGASAIMERHARPAERPASAASTALTPVVTRESAADAGTSVAVARPVSASAACSPASSGSSCDPVSDVKAKPE